MKNMQFLLKLLAGSALSSGAAISVVACNNNNVATADISSGVMVNGLRVAAQKGATYEALNSNSTVNDAVASAIASAKNVSVTAGTDFKVSNDQIKSSIQVAGEKVNFIVTAISDLIKGSFSFNVTLSKPDISSGVTVDDLQTGFNPIGIYGDLNNNVDLINAVASAIKTAKNIDVAAGTDFVLTNDQSYNATQVAGKQVIFTVTAMGDQITGNFTFKDTLGKADISSGVVVTDPQTSTDPNATYGDLNNNNNIKNAVLQAIKAAKSIDVNANDIALANDQDATSKQVVGQLVTFTVSGTGNQLKGSFTFTDTLSKASIRSGIFVADLQTIPNPNASYTSLNSDQTINDAIIAAISSAKNVTVTSSDYVLTNDGGTGNQVPGTLVTFTVTATDSGAVTGSFTFVDTLGKVSIANGVTISSLTINADPGLKYSDLNNNNTIKNAVISAINSAKGTNATINDISLTNDQTASSSQTAGTNVTFTVTGIKGQITDSFTFTVNLVKADISTGVNVADLRSVFSPNATYGTLNSNTTLLTAITNAINNAKNVSVTAGTDFTVTNNQTATSNQVAGQAVLFTVTATSTSNVITGSFTFTNTLSKISINNGVTVADPLTPVNSTTTFDSLNTNTSILAAVATAINTAKGITVTAGTDFTLTNNKIGTGTLTSGIVTFTVNATATSNLITGSFTFIDTIQKVSISTGVGITSVTFQVRADRYFNDLNRDSALFTIIQTAISNTKGVLISAVPGVDIVLSITPSTGNQATGTYPMVATATNTSKLVTGSFNFNIVLT